MGKIKVKELTVDRFRAYGEFYDFINPSGKHMGDLYHDHILEAVSGDVQMAFSAYVVRKATPMIVTKVEYHDETSEILMPLDGDIITHVAPASCAPVAQQTEAFLIPRGTMVRLHAGVWHQESFAVDQETVHCLIVLPERTYKRDCTLVSYAPENQVEIELTR